MKILSMRASFGKLQNASLELGSGLTIIEAPNEGGKSTWCAFLRAMLYGIPTGQRDKQGYIAEKNRYQPWGGGALEGAMDLLWQEKAITIRRGPKGSTPFGAFSAVTTDTGETVPELNGENCGEKLLGVSREVYERSAFVGEGGAAMGASGELERRIASLVSSGEEDVSYSQVAKRLRDWQNRRKHNATGSIPKLENELALLQDSLLRQEKTRNQSEDARREIDLLTLRRNELAAQAEAHRSLANEARREKYEAAAADFAAAQAAAATLSAELGQVPDTEQLRTAQGDLAYLRTLDANLKLARVQEETAHQAATEGQERLDPLFPGMTAQGAQQQAAADAARISAALAAAGRAEKWRWLSGGIALICLAAVAGLGWFLLPALRLPLLGGCLIVFLVCAGLGLVLGGKKAKAQRATAQRILEQYGAETAEDLARLAEAYALRCRLAEDADRRAAEATTAREKLEGERRDTLQGLLELVHGFEPNVTDVFGISAALSRALGLRERLTAADVRLEGAARLVSSLPAPIGAPAAPGMVPPENSPMETAAALGAAERELARLQNVVAQARGELST
ncbi:MAG: AAA family ATPase, partial [Pseudoflavonifractor sp.]